MDTLQFHVSSSAFGDGLAGQINKLGLRELVNLFGKTALLETEPKSQRAKCSLKIDDSGISFDVSKSDIAGAFGGAAIASIGPSQRAKLCKHLAREVVSRKGFQEGGVGDKMVEGGEVDGGGFTFMLPVTASEISKIDFEKLGTSAVVALKKKVLSALLSGGKNGVERGRPVGAYVKVVNGSLFVELGQDQAVAVLKRSLNKLNPEQLSGLDSRLCGALTSLPSSDEQA